MLKRVDDRENLAELAIKLRYTLNAKDVKAKKVFDRNKEENSIHRAFDSASNKLKKNTSTFAQKIKEVTEYFRNKGKE